MSKTLLSAPLATLEQGDDWRWPTLKAIAGKNVVKKS
jgi:hypothetical protein